MGQKCTSMSEITKRSQCQRFSLRKNALKHNIDLLLKTRAAAMIYRKCKSHGRQAAY